MKNINKYSILKMKFIELFADWVILHAFYVFFSEQTLSNQLNWSFCLKFCWIYIP